MATGKRLGACRMISTAQLARSTADGCIRRVANAIQTQHPALNAKPRFDPIDDFEPIAQNGRSYGVLSVMPDFPARDIKALVALAGSGWLDWSRWAGSAFCCHPERTSR